MHFSVLFYALSFLYLAQASPTVPRQPLPGFAKIPLNTRQADVDVSTLKNVLAAAKTRYVGSDSLVSAVGAGGSARLAKRQAERGNLNFPTQKGSVYLSGSNDGTPYGNVSTGPHSPFGDDLPQTSFQVLFDTGSADFLLPGPNCTGCVNGTVYEPTGSDMKTDTSVPYGVNSGFDVKGHNYLDDATVGSIISYFTVVTAMTDGQDAFGPNYVGVLGLGFSGLALNRQSCFFENLVMFEKVTSTEFAFFFGRAGETPSEFSLGGRDTTRFKGEVTTITVSEKKWWKIPIDGYKVNNDSPNLKHSGQAIIDTGTPVIFGPRAVVHSLYKAMDPSAHLDKDWSGDGIDVWNYRCKAYSDVGLVFGGRTFGIDKRDFQWMRIEGQPKRCRGSISGMDLGGGLNDTWVIGEPFLRSWYSIFSYVVDKKDLDMVKNAKATVSFAEAVGSQEQPNTKPPDGRPAAIDGNFGP